jgi:hypothetical protein
VPDWVRVTGTTENEVGRKIRSMEICKLERSDTAVRLRIVSTSSILRSRKTVWIRTPDSGDLTWPCLGGMIGSRHWSNFDESVAMKLNQGPDSIRV